MRMRMDPVSSSRGVSLLELVVVLTLLGLVGSIIGASLVRQQRFFRGAGELLGTRENVRDAMEVLSTDIRGLSVADTVRLMTDSAVEFFANIGSAVTCSGSVGAEVGLAGTSGRRGNTLTALITQPDTGDVAMVYRGADDAIAPVWERAPIASFAPRSVAAICPESKVFALGEAGRGYQLAFSSPLPSVPAGTPIRFIRRGRYSLYRAGDGEWYLGYRRCNAAGPPLCGAVQPLSGPYHAYSSDPGQSGLLFEYFDGSGVPTLEPLELARIRITARSESRQRIPIERRVWRPADSATLSIALRNRGP